MSLGVEHIIIQTDEVWRGEDQIEVLEGLRQPETLQQKKKSSQRLQSITTVVWQRKKNHLPP